MSILNWSATAADNDDADLANGIDWREGQLAATVNNSSRATMAALYKFVRDISGDLTTTGSGAAYVLTTAQTITSLSEPLILAFKASFTCNAAATLNVDGLGAIDILRNDGSATQSGDIVSTGAYLVIYSGALSKFIGINIVAGGSGISNVVEDTSPSLGGPLDADGFDINDGGVIFLREQAAAEADVAGQGQIWVETQTPNLLKFTDDAGTDFTVATTAVLAAGYQPLDADLTSWAGVTRAAGFDTWVATPSSTNLASLVTGETGSGALVFGTSPGFTTAANPVSNDGAALGTTALQWSDLFLAEGAVINFDNGDATITQTGNDITIAGITTFGFGTSTAVTLGTIELGAASDTTLSRSAAGVLAVEGVVVPSISSTNTLTNKRVTPRVGSTTSSATPTINTDNVDIYQLTAQTADITSFTTNLSGTPTEGQKLIIEVTGTAARAITWGASFEASTVALPTTTVTTAKLSVGFMWNAVTSKWRCMASA